MTENFLDKVKGLEKATGDERAFTLIELMVVLLIIAILVLMAVVVSGQSRAAAYRRTCQANLRILDGAVQTYHANEEKWPSGIADLVPRYIKREPRAPLNNAQYIYSSATHDFSCPNNGHVVNGINATGHEYP